MISVSELQNFLRIQTLFLFPVAHQFMQDLPSDNGKDGDTSAISAWRMARNF